MLTFKTVHMYAKLHPDWPALLMHLSCFIKHFIKHPVQFQVLNLVQEQGTVFFVALASSNSFSCRSMYKAFLRQTDRTKYIKTKVMKLESISPELTNPWVRLSSVPASLSPAWGDQSINLCAIRRSVIFLNHADELLAFSSFFFFQLYSVIIAIYNKDWLHPITYLCCYIFKIYHRCPVLHKKIKISLHITYHWAHYR